MGIREGLRPGGRSARVQESVHKAVRELLDSLPRSEVTVPLIAARAGVTPSTIYRRWGDLQELLADVAMQRMRPDREPLNTGRLQGDLQAWIEQFLEELSSRPGRAMLRDVLGSSAEVSPASACSAFICTQVGVMLDRAKARGEAVPDINTLMDRVIAPVMYRILFSEPLDANYARTLVVSCVPGATY